MVAPHSTPPTAKLSSLAKRHKMREAIGECYGFIIFTSEAPSRVYLCLTRIELLTDCGILEAAGIS